MQCNATQGTGYQLDPVYAWALGEMHERHAGALNPTTTPSTLAGSYLGGLLVALPVLVRVVADARAGVVADGAQLRRRGARLRSGVPLNLLFGSRLAAFPEP